MRQPHLFRQSHAVLFSSEAADQLIAKVWCNWCEQRYLTQWRSTQTPQIVKENWRWLQIKLAKKTNTILSAQLWGFSEPIKIYVLNANGRASICLASGLPDDSFFLAVSRQSSLKLHYIMHIINLLGPSKSSSWEAIINCFSKPSYISWQEQRGNTVRTLCNANWHIDYGLFMPRATSCFPQWF